MKSIGIRTAVVSLAGIALGLSSLTAAPPATAAVVDGVRTSAQIVVTPSAVKPKISVSPHSNLKDGQTIKVKGSGFPASTMIIIVECKTKSKANCNKLKLGVGQSNAGGSFSATFKVFTGTVGKKTCAKGSTCAVGVADGKGKKIAYSAIKFKK